MQIDWFTTGAQVINFLVLVWLLKKFFYRPVMETMGRRQQIIADTLDQARSSQIEADREKERYLALQQEIKQKGLAEIQRARDEAETLRKELIETARQEAEQSRQRWHKALAEEKDRFLEQSARLFTHQFHALARQSFQTLAHQHLEQTIIDLFWQKFKHNKQSVMAFVDRIQANAPLTVTTFFPPAPPMKAQIMTHVTELFGPDTTVVFEQDDALIMGITLEAGGKKVAWGQGQYLDEFTRRLDLALENEIHAA